MLLGNKKWRIITEKPVLGIVRLRAQLYTGKTCKRLLYVALRVLND